MIDETTKMLKDAIKLPPMERAELIDGLLDKL
jgi:hypothetical protein